MTASDNLTGFGVLLYEVAIALTILVTSLKTFTIGGLLDCLAMTDTAVVRASELCPVVIMDGDDPLKLAVAELTVKTVTVFLYQSALSALLVLVPVACIDIAILPCVGAGARTVAIEEAACIGVAASIFHHSSTGALASNILAIIDVAIAEGVNTFAMR